MHRTGEKYKYIFSIGEVRIKPQVYRGLLWMELPSKTKLEYYMLWQLQCKTVITRYRYHCKLFYKFLFIAKICFNEQQLQPCWYGSCHVPVYYKWSSGFSSKNWSLKAIHESINMSWRQADSMVELVSGNACPLEFFKSNIKYAVFLE